MSTPQFSIVSFSREHSRVGFYSGSEILDRYFAERADQDIRRNLAKCFVAIDNEQKNVAGFYTHSAAQIPLIDLPEPLAKNLPRYDAIPASRLRRLAIAKPYQKKGLGSSLIVDALKKSLDASMAVYALLVDARDEKAEQFYRHHGFISCIDRPQILFLPLTCLGRCIM